MLHTDASSHTTFTMLRETSHKVKQKTRKVVHRGIVSAAARLGVHRIHLYLVLSGKRRSNALLARYHALKQEAA